MKQQKAITLIALIITIVILLILAAATVSTLGKHQIIGKSSNTKSDLESEIESFDKLQANLQANLIAGLPSGNTSGSTENNGTIGEDTSIDTEDTENKTETIAPIVDTNGNDITGQVVSSNTEAWDEYGNKIVVPKGFKIVVDESTNYADHVTEGIVIEDSTYTGTMGSQFVWIPVGKVYKNASKEYETIILGTYSFKHDTFEVKDCIRGPLDTEEEKYFASSYIATPSCYEYNSNTSSVEQYERARDICGFYDGSVENGGFYFGRTAARFLSYKDYYGKNYDSFKTGIDESSTYYYIDKITRAKASELSVNMYKSDSGFFSDLGNGFAYDTVIRFLSIFEPNFYLTIFQAGSAGGALEKGCNVYNLDYGVQEWTTEWSTYKGVDGNEDYAVCRGGYNTVGTVDGIIWNFRHTMNKDIADQWNDAGFRPIIYFN